jgi:archaellum component FlaD/FlaE
MGNILKKLQEKRIDNLYDRKKKATMSGNIEKKERIDAKIAKVRGKTLSDEDYTMKNGGSTNKKTPKAAMVMLMKKGGKKPKMKAGGSTKRK